MKFRSSTIVTTLLALVLLGLFTITVEMRPGRVYYVLQMLLFQSSILDLLLFITIVTLSIWGQLLFILNKNRNARRIYLALLLPCLLISLSYKFITGYNYSYTDAQTALANLHSLGAALQNFTLQILLALVSSIVIAFVFWRVTHFIKPIYNLKHIILLLPIAITGFWFINKSNGVIDDLPAFYRVPLSTYLAASHELPLGQRQSVTIAPEKSGVKHLFFIVDESITGSSLSLNGNPVTTTPFLDTHRDSIHNAGIATSFTNNSAGSNIALISGARLAQLPDTDHQLLTAPSIFQFAKNAGYTTYYFDSQIGGGGLQNFMSLQDLESIDHFIQPANVTPKMPYFMRDHWVAQQLIKLAKSDDKIFVYVTKAGAHWPYARTYPPDSATFRPVLSQRSMLKDKVRSVDTYHNAIRWTVDQFWEKLIKNIQASDSTFILYTSDHGQDLSGDGISMVHASTTATKPIEADVPLWYMDKSNIAAAYTRGKTITGRRSHEHIFPTLLLLQGYNRQYVQQNYGISLFTPASSSGRKFLTGDIFGRGRNHIIDFDF